MFNIILIIMIFPIKRYFNETLYTFKCLESLEKFKPLSINFSSQNFKLEFLLSSLFY